MVAVVVLVDDERSGIAHRFHDTDEITVFTEVRVLEGDESAPTAPAVFTLS